MRKVLLLATATILVVSAIAVAQENTLSDARVGEWALYRTSSGSVQERHSVITRRRQVVVVRVDSIVNGKVISSRTENYRLNSPDFLRGAEGRRTVAVGGRNYDCVVVSKGKRTFFYSNQVPVTGLVLVRRDGDEVKGILDFGY